MTAPVPMQDLGSPIATATLLDAIRVWGTEAQARMAQEECGELIAVINRLERRRCSRSDVAQEIADVQIMCAQLAFIVGLDEVSDARVRKLERLADRITVAKARSERDGNPHANNPGVGTPSCNHASCNRGDHAGDCQRCMEVDRG